MTAQKKRYKIEKRSGTVIGLSNGVIVIMSNDMVLYRIDKKAQPQFSKVKADLGKCLWIYCVPSRNEVLTVMDGGKENEPPVPDSYIELGDQVGAGVNNWDNEGQFREDD